MSEEKSDWPFAFVVGLAILSLTILVVAGYKDVAVGVLIGLGALFAVFLL